MNKELEELIERSKEVTLTKEQLDEGRIQIAAANGAITDDRITVDTMRAARTIAVAAQRPKTR